MKRQTGIVDEAKVRFEKKYEVKIEYVPEGHTDFGEMFFREGPRPSQIKIEEGLTIETALHVMAHEVAHHIRLERNEWFVSEDEYEIDLLANELLIRYVPDYPGKIWDREWTKEEYERLGYTWPL